MRRTYLAHPVKIFGAAYRTIRRTVQNYSVHSIEMIPCIQRPIGLFGATLWVLQRQPGMRHARAKQRQIQASVDWSGLAHSGWASKATLSPELEGHPSRVARQSIECTE